MPHGPSGADFVLTLSCPDRPGIVHAVSGFLVERGANIVESQQFGDRLTDRFFMRIGFVVETAGGAEALRAAFAAVAQRFEMAYELWAAAVPTR
ncbi:MAG: ACT domain-containing protein, partial [Gammaproteobacteria bacterium]